MGDTEVLIREFTTDFDMIRAMDAAGYVGRGRFRRAANDIKNRADELRRPVCDDGRMSRILAEYERIAFAENDDKIRVADKLKALEMYRILSSGEVPSSGCGLVVTYDYGD